jgi:Domain of unknown function (DUF4926)
MTTQYSLYSQVALTQDLPEYQLKKGAIATIVEHYPMTEAEDGYSLEGFDTPNVTIEVSASQIAPIGQFPPAANITAKLYQLSPAQLIQLDEYLDFLLHQEQAEQEQIQASSH